MDVQWWHWMALGLALIVLEIFVPSFVIVWFGLSGLLVGAASWLLEISLAAQIFLWAISSILLTAFWFRCLNPHIRNKTLSGMALEDIVGQTGMVVTPPSEGRRGRVRFSVPVQGSEEWEFLCEEKVETGDILKIVGTSGNTLLAKK